MHRNNDYQWGVKYIEFNWSFLTLLFFFGNTSTLMNKGRFTPTIVIHKSRLKCVDLIKLTKVIEWSLRYRGEEEEEEEEDWLKEGFWVYFGWILSYLIQYIRIFNSTI
jgi:hypothetical protein